MYYPISHTCPSFSKNRIWTFSLIWPLVKSTVTQLETLKTVPGAFFQQADGVISNALQDFEIRRSSKDDFKRNVYNKYLENLCKQIEDRFSDAGLLESFSVYDFTTWPDEYSPGDGEEHIEELIKQYQPVVEHQATSAEWSTFVNVVQAKLT